MTRPLLFVRVRLSFADSNSNLVPNFDTNMWTLRIGVQSMIR